MRALGESTFRDQAGVTGYGSATGGSIGSVCVMKLVSFTRGLGMAIESHDKMPKWVMLVVLVIFLFWTLMTTFFNRAAHFE